MNYNNIVTGVQNDLADAGVLFTTGTGSIVEKAINEGKDFAYDWISNLRDDWGIARDTTKSFAADATSLTLPADLLELITIWRVMTTGDNIELHEVALQELENPVNVYRVAKVRNSAADTWTLYRPQVNKAELWTLIIEYLPTIADQTTGGTGFYLGPMIDRLITALAVRECIRTRKPQLLAVWKDKVDEIQGRIQDKLPIKTGARYVNYISP